MKSPFSWDPYSDQPALLKDRAYKKRMRRTQRWAYLRMLVTSLWVLPVAILAMPFFKGNRADPRDFYGIGVSLERGEGQFDLIRDLGVRHVLIRMPLWEMDRIDEHVEFVRRFHEQGCQILINVLQDREHIEDPGLLRADLGLVFRCLAPYAQEYQIGNAINRSKWGFFSADEYLDFYRTAQLLRDVSFPSLKLVGPAVIDFEYHYTVRALFNLSGLRFDRISALLYVDRRGAPENRQYGFNTRLKIALLYSMARISRLVRNPNAYITEVNWPLSGTAPYAPTSETECVTPDEYARYMRDYLEMALNSGKVERVYWHQLIAPGYGLVDNRNGAMKKYPAYQVVKDLVEQVNG